MDIHFDPAFDWLWVLVAGQQAPRVDVAATRALAQGWAEGGTTLQGMGNTLVALTTEVERSVGGEVARSFRKYVERLASTVPQLVALARQQSNALLDLALNVELGIYSMMIEIAFFASSIVWALASPFTAPLVPSFVTGARMAVNRIVGQLHRAIRLVGEALQEGVAEVFQGALAQIAQFIEGHRHVWDGQSTLVEFVAGSAAGGIAGGMHAGAHRYRPDIQDKAWFHGFTEAVADVAVGVGAAAILGQGMDDVWAGAVNGGFSGAAGKGVDGLGERIDQVVNGPRVAAPDTSGFVLPDEPPVLAGQERPGSGASGPGGSGSSGAVAGGDDLFTGAPNIDGVSEPLPAEAMPHPRQPSPLPGTPGYTGTGTPRSGAPVADAPPVTTSTPIDAFPPVDTVPPAGTSVGLLPVDPGPATSPRLPVSRITLVVEPPPAVDVSPDRLPMTGTPVEQVPMVHVPGASGGSGDDSQAPAPRDRSVDASTAPPPWTSADLPVRDSPPPAPDHGADSSPSTTTGSTTAPQPDTAPVTIRPEVPTGSQPSMPDPVMPDPVMPDPVMPDPVMLDPVMLDPVMPDPATPAPQQTPQPDTAIPGGEHPLPPGTPVVSHVPGGPPGIGGVAAGGVFGPDRGIDAPADSSAQSETDTRPPAGQPHPATDRPGTPHAGTAHPVEAVGTNPEVQFHTPAVESSGHTSVDSGEDASPDGTTSENNPPVDNPSEVDPEFAADGRNDVTTPPVPGTPAAFVDPPIPPDSAVPAVGAAQPQPVFTVPHGYPRDQLDIAPPQQRGRVHTAPGWPAPVRSAFEVRRAGQGHDVVVEVTVVVDLDPGGRYDDATKQQVMRDAQLAVDEFYNKPDLRLRNGDLLRFRIMPRTGAGPVHHVVELDPEHDIDQTHWRPGQFAAHTAHEFGHMIGLVEEYSTTPGRLDVAGTVMGRHVETDPDGTPRLMPEIRVPQRSVDILALAIGDPSQEAGGITRPLPEGTALPKAFTGVPEASGTMRDRNADVEQPGEQEQQSQDHEHDAQQGTTRQDGLAARPFRDGLPDYLRTSRSLGVAGQKGTTRGEALDIGARLEQFATGVRKWEDVDGVVKALEKSIAGTLADGGARAVVKGDGRTYELKMRSTLHWDRAQPAGTGTYALIAGTKDKRKTSEETGYKRDADIMPTMQFSGMPGFVVQAVPGVPIAPTEDVSGGTKKELAHSSKIAFSSPREVDVPLTVRFSLVDANGKPVDVGGGGQVVEAAASVLLTVPTDLATEDDAGALVHDVTSRGTAGQDRTESLARHGIRPVDRREPPPKRFVAESVVVHRGTHPASPPPFADQVIALLGARHAKATAVGAHGRDVVHEFVGEDNIKANLRRMVVFDGDANPEAGWVRSEPIFRGGSRGGVEWRPRSTRIEMRAVARWVRVNDTRGGMTVTERRHEHYERSHRTKVKRRWGVFGFVGGGADVRPVGTAAGGLTYNASVERNASSGLERSTAAKEALDIKGDVVRYEVVYDIEVRQVGAAGRKPWTLEGNVSSHQWATLEHAGRAGIVPRPPDGFRSGPDRTTWGPSEFEDGQALLGLVEEFTSGELLNRAIHPLLTKLPKEEGWYFDRKKFLRHLEHRKHDKRRFVRSFTDPGIDSGRLTGKVAQALELGANLGDALSDQEISHLVEHMSDRGSGLHIPLKRAGWFHDREVTVILKARVGDIEEGKALDAAEITGLSRTKDVTSSEFGQGREVEFGGGPQGRLLAPLGTLPSTSPFGVLLAGVRGSRAWLSDVVLTLGAKRNVERKRGDSLTEDGKIGNRAVRQFRAKVTITGEIDYSERHNKSIRKISFGRRGRHAPHTEQLTAPGPVELDLRVLVPEALLTGPDRDPSHDGRARRPDRPIDQDALALPHALRPTMSRAFDDVDVVAFTAAPAVQASATDVLSAAADHDPVVRSRNQAIARAISDRLSPEALTSDPRLFSRTTVIDSSQLTYERRTEDLTATLGVTFRPTLSARQVTAQEYQEVVREHEASSKASGSGGTTTQARGYAVAVPLLTQKGYTPAAGGTNEVAARGLFVVVASPYGTSSGATAAAHLKSGEKLAVGTPPQRMILARVDIEATVVAEARHRGNLSFGLATPDPAKARGAVVDLPESALVWLTEDQFHELSTGRPPERGAVTPTGDRAVETPASLRPDRTTKPSIGLGGIIDPIDLSARIDTLRANLARTPGIGPDLAARLLPDSALDPKNANIAAVTWFLSDANRMVNSLLNGGTATPVRLEDRFSGRTYELTLDAAFTQAPEPGTVKNLTKLKSAVTAEFGTKEVTSRTRTFFTGMVSARPALTIQEKAGPATADGRAQGQVGGGLNVEKTTGVRDHKKTAERSTKYTHAAAHKGPAATHRGTLDLTVALQRHGRTLASVLVTEDVEITKLADEAFPEPEHGGRLGSAEPVAPATSAVMSTDDLATWRTGRDGGPKTTRLPGVEDYWVEHYFGDVDLLRAHAKEVLVHSGVRTTAAIERALKTGITPASVRAGLTAGTEGTFTVPLPGGLGRTVEIHIRLPAPPRFAGAGAGVDIKSYRMDTEKEEVKLTTGGTVEVAQTAPFGAGGESNSAPQGQSGASPARQPLDDKSASAQRQVTTFAAPAANRAENTRTAGPARTFEPLMPWTITPEHKLSRVLLTGAEFRIIAKPASKPLFGSADKVSYQDVTVHDAYAVRVRDDKAVEMTGRTLPPALIDATTALADKGKAWLTAEQRRRAATAERDAREHPIDADARTRADRLAELDDLTGTIAGHEVEVRRLRRRLDAAIRAAAGTSRPLRTGNARNARTELAARRQAWHTASLDLRRLVERKHHLTAALSAGGVDVEQLRRYAAALRAERAAAEAEQAAEQEWWHAKTAYDREVAALHEQEEFRRRVPTRAGRPPVLPPIAETGGFDIPLPGTGGR
ncbi:WXG100-like domain-containing protein [Saccharothrix yanglingensis]|uniref:Outer membrane channel protein CpnT-like N-terminal domain-containing protein n=1 Tax=Saccharothrix yanglingensis TaxID=659496 RepID=A0ABU0X8P7_9PSEU|nr:hypothetical protein [Saccharothrix yanglingensis]MDQ2588078.1 hypothetical protein [Saccharothrix yanglingensis]